MSKVQEASSIVRVGFALLKYPHFKSTYLVRVRFSLDLVVRAQQSTVLSFKVTPNTHKIPKKILPPLPEITDLEEPRSPVLDT